MFKDFNNNEDDNDLLNGFIVIYDISFDVDDVYRSAQR